MEKVIPVLSCSVHRFAWIRRYRTSQKSPAQLNQIALSNVIGRYSWRQSAHIDGTRAGKRLRICRVGWQSILPHGMFFAPISASVVRRFLCAEHAQQHRCRLILMLSALPCQPHRSSHRSSLLVPHRAPCHIHHSEGVTKQADAPPISRAGRAVAHQRDLCGVIPLSAARLILRQSGPTLHSGVFCRAYETSSILM